MRNLETRIMKLETEHAPPQAPVQMYLLPKGEPLPDGVDENDPNVMVIRLVGVQPSPQPNGQSSDAIN